MKLQNSFFIYLPVTFFFVATMKLLDEWYILGKEVNVDYIIIHYIAALGLGIALGAYFFLMKKYLPPLVVCFFSKKGSDIKKWWVLPCICSFCMGSAFAFTYVMYILFTSRHIDFIDIIFFILFPAVGFMAGVLANCALARILKKMENNPNT